MKKFVYFLFGTVLGSIVGSGVALLFAPVSGKDARDKLTAYFTKIKEDMIQASQEKRVQLEAELDALRSGK